MDLDGVLNNYTGNYDANYIPVVKDGAKNFIEKLSEKYEIKLFTTRPKQLAQQWLSKHNLDKYIKETTNVKIPAWLYIDDRCIRFDGNYSNLYNEIENFQVWHKLNL